MRGPERMSDVTDVLPGMSRMALEACPGRNASHSALPIVPLSRFVIQLLEDLVFFVSDVPNNGQNVLDIMVTKPNRERQKLMREQNILKQVLVGGVDRCLTLPFACSRSLSGSC